MKGNHVAMEREQEEDDDDKKKKKLVVPLLDANKNKNNTRDDKGEKAQNSSGDNDKVPSPNENVARPMFEPSYGYMTAKARSRFLSWYGLTTLAQKSQTFRQVYYNHNYHHDSTTDDDNNDNAIHDSVVDAAADNDQNDARLLSLCASQNENEPLYFWQIFSLTGMDPILQLLTNFYNRIYNDHEADWFRSIFMDLASKQHHIQAQTLMWLDCFGGGRLYHGGEFRLNWHHQGTHALPIMTVPGAERWMNHMNAALKEEESKENGAFFGTESRVRPALNTFLQFFLQSYGNSFGFSAATNKPEMFGSILLPPGARAE
ncbi:hypothetical protein ACA910_000406 [Epithemia clementina (nom. ined.)]